MTSMLQLKLWCMKYCCTKLWKVLKFFYERNWQNYLSQHIVIHWCRFHSGVQCFFSAPSREAKYYIHYEFLFRKSFRFSQFYELGSVLIVDRSLWKQKLTTTVDQKDCVNMVNAYHYYLGRWVWGRGALLFVNTSLSLREVSSSSYIL